MSVRRAINGKPAGVCFEISMSQERRYTSLAPMSWFKAFLKGFTTPMSSEGSNSVEGSNNFTEHATQILAMARLEAARFNHSFVGTEHLLLGLVRLGKGTAAAVLSKIGVDLEALKREVERQVGVAPDEKIASNISITPRVKKVLALAAKEARDMNDSSIGSEHILLGLMREGDGVAARVLKNFDLEIGVVKECILKELDPNYPSTAMEDESEKRRRVMIDVSKRYDVYCRDVDGEAVYRNVRFKGVRNLFKEREFGFAEFMEIEQVDGTVIFIGRHSIARFCEHGVTPKVEIIPRKKE